MNASNAFRSHLMQQFVAAARNQHRPPLALVGWMTDEESGNHSPAVEALPPQPRLSSRALSSLASHQSSHASGPLKISSTSSLTRRNTAPPALGRLPHRSLSAASTLTDEPAEEDASEDLHASQELSELFQNMLQTRRTATKFAPHLPRLDERVQMEETMFWMDALERAVAAGYAAPNHRRTEPFTFKRMVAPSPQTVELAEIAYQVALRKESKKEGVTKETLMQTAQKKRDKWNGIPAFLVALVSTPDSLAVLPDPERDRYDPLPYVPPATEKALEDYASTCAAIQNVLLSLHAEDLAAKWVTGPVIGTPAFRQLVEANNSTDRVVGLIMVGQRTNATETRPRRHRRALRGDVLQDL